MNIYLGVISEENLVLADALSVYAEWVQLGRLNDAGLLNACGYMLHTPDFRLAACDILRKIVERKQLQARNFPTASSTL